MDMILLDPQGKKCWRQSGVSCFLTLRTPSRRGDYFVMHKFGVEKYESNYRLIDHNWNAHIVTYMDDSCIAEGLTLWAEGKESSNEMLKLKEALVSEVGCLRLHLQQVSDDRDHLLSSVQDLSVEVSKYKE